MTRIIFSMIALLLAASARADVSDSGNLTIGGNGVIQGTMTVQGNAFSVGGATFSVAGGSITLGGRINAAAAGIMWSDGTISTTASSGGAVHISSGASVNFSPGAFATTALSFTGAASVTNSTISFTVQGTTVACWANGVGNNNLSYGGTIISVGVDGKINAIPNTSSTVGLNWADVPGAGGYPEWLNFYVEFQVAGGGTSHSFWLGVWTYGGGTSTWPFNSTQGTFGCREVMSR